MKTKFLFLFALFVVQLNAQNFQTFRSDVKALYENSEGIIEKSLGIDSVKFINGDSILYPGKNFREVKAYCYTPYGSSWIGEKIIIKKNGFNLFLNKNHDTISIKTNAVLNESWKLYVAEDSSYFLATVTAFDTLSFLSVNDSVKTIRIKVYDKNSALVGSYSKLLLSKNFGLINPWNFYYFNQDPYAHNEEEGYVLSGMQNLTWKQVHDYVVGDELHIVEWSESLSIPCLDQSTRKCIKKILSRQDIGDTVLYTIEESYLLKSKKSFCLINDSSLIHFKDTVTCKVFDGTWFDRLPEEAIGDSFSRYEMKMKENNGLRGMAGILAPVKITPAPNEQFSINVDSCLKSLIYDGCENTGTYIKGLGGPYFDQSFNCGFGSDGNRLLVYYKKGSEEWGKPLDMTIGVSEIRASVDLTIYPNPSSENIFIKTAETNLPYQLQITDVDGKTVCWETVNTAIWPGFRSQQARGMYFYKVTTAQGLTAFGKIILQ